jgi:hypothetical protein
MKSYFALSFVLIFQNIAHAQLATPPLATRPPEDLVKVCKDRLKKVPGQTNFKKLNEICAQAEQLPACRSVKGEPIFHYEQKGLQTNKDKEPLSSQRVLVFGLIHGDEEHSTSVATAWADRLVDIQPRNTWRVIPVLNPDGWDLKTRTNAHGIDVNRNFPSHDWNELALKYWRTKMKSNPRRYPGAKPGSEPETQCAMAQIEDFKPDFIISIHTPLGVLDFDGPKVPAPHFQPLPWVSLGNYPGSLGRYMWLDRHVPVLTVELKAQNDVNRSFEEFDRLQDITGTVAIQAEKLLKKKVQ